MKIIGLTLKSNYGNHYMVDMSAEELSLIVYGTPDRYHEAEIGTVYKPHGYWKRNKDIDAAAGKLKASAQSLRAMADLLETVSVVVPPAAEEGK